MFPYSEIFYNFPVSARILDNFYYTFICIEKTSFPAINVIQIKYSRT